MNPMKPPIQPLMKPVRRITQAEVQLSSDRPVRVQPVAIARPVEPHDHDYHEICLFTAGHCRHLTAAGTKTMSAGDAVVIRPDEVHAFDSPKDCRATNIYYLAEWLDSDASLLWDEPGLVPLFCSGSLVRMPDSGVKEFSLTDDERIAAVHDLSQIETELTQPQPGQAFLRSCFLKTLVVLARAWCRSDPAWKVTIFPAAVRRTLAAVERSIAAGEPYSVADTAESLDLTPDRLTALFRESLGYPPLEYFQRRRVQRACQLLADVRQSITDVAMTLGYSDAPHFSRLFKEHRGMTPREYRKTFVTKTRDVTEAT